MVLADLVQPSSSSDRVLDQSHAVDHRPPVYKAIDVEPLKKTAPDFIVTFTEDKSGFYINGRKFAPDATPMTTASVGTYQHWRIINQTAELHPSTYTRFTSWLTPKTASRSRILYGWIP